MSTDEQMAEYRRKNFAVRAEPMREPDFDGEKLIHYTYYGSREYAMQLAPHEARKLYDLLGAEFGLGGMAGELPPLPDFGMDGYCGESAYTTDQMNDHYLAGVAAGRGAAVRDYVSLNDAALAVQQAPDAARDAVDAARYRWLRDAKPNSLNLSRNDDHACNYVTAKQWIEESVPEDYANCAPEELQAMKATDTIWHVQIYPDTPIGSYSWYAATLDSVIDMAIKDMQSQPALKLAEDGKGE